MPKHIHTGPGEGPDALPFSQVIEANGFVFLAGQVGNEPGTHVPIGGGIEAETRQMLENVGWLLRTVGLDFVDVVKTTVYLREFDEFARMNAIYREYFPTDPPTRATVGVTRLAADYRVEIEVIATR
jgi:2-iminobutanoate/2-iminopropanoate deaminase